MALGALEPKFWQLFCDLVEHPEWKQRIMDTGDQQAALKAEVSMLFLSKTQTEWLRLANGKDICLSPVLDIEQLQNDPQLRHRNMIVEQQTTEGHPYYSTGIPLKFGDTPAEIAWAPPALGEDSIAILKELQYTDSQIKDLLQKQIVSPIH
jgi:crotonobetainyl-CoA:carnitine CoA-transferase CaiB-like acyl-CoA transferase